MTWDKNRYCCRIRFRIKLKTCRLKQITKHPIVKILRRGSKMLFECSTFPRKSKIKKHKKTNKASPSQPSRKFLNLNTKMKKRSKIQNGSDPSCSSRKLVKCTQSKSTHFIETRNYWRDLSCTWSKKKTSKRKK